LRRSFLVLAAIIVLPLLVLTAFYSSLNVTATNGPIFPGFGFPGGTGNQTNRLEINITATGNSSIPASQIYPNIFPNISVPSYLLSAIVAILMTLVGAVIILNLRIRGPSMATGFDDEGELDKDRRDVADVLDRAALELRKGGEYRETVLECYRRICSILETKSKIDGDALTAREFEVAVSGRLKFNSPYLSQITDIFEIARYSDQNISQEQADRAIDCLSRLSAALRG
jgi:hypothetical protein